MVRNQVDCEEHPKDLSGMCEWATKCQMKLSVSKRRVGKDPSIYPSHIHWWKLNWQQLTNEEVCDHAFVLNENINSVFRSCEKNVLVDWKGFANKRQHCNVLTSIYCASAFRVMCTVLIVPSHIMHYSASQDDIYWPLCIRVLALSDYQNSDLKVEEPEPAAALVVWPWLPKIWSPLSQFPPFLHSGPQLYGVLSFACLCSNADSSWGGK